MIIYRITVLTAVLLVNLFVSPATTAMEKRVLRKLTPTETRVIVDKGTEPPFSGIYNDFFETGTYVCKRCGTPLYRSRDKFRSTCGWPSFDDEIAGAVRREPDADGFRTEILCAACGAHLGHIFTGEQLTPKNTRHCVNSISLLFVPAQPAGQPEPENRKAYFAGGCFWGLEYHFEHHKGVISATSGYMGGTLPDPSYREVCTGRTGHLETVEVIYNPQQVSYEELAKFFFEIHDPTQTDGQGPDLGSQYLSAIFYRDPAERETARKLITILTDKGYKIATRLLPAQKFWPAEDYHQDYYDRKKQRPYCHIRRKRF